MFSSQLQLPSTEEWQKIALKLYPYRLEGIRLYAIVKMNELLSLIASTRHIATNRTISVRLCNAKSVINLLTINNNRQQTVVMIKITQQRNAWASEPRMQHSSRCFHSRSMNVV